ncbi:NAD-dependent deacetylase sirtuin-2, putative [Entamoeba invadens IP1]|uniref:NAD-dependent deacetylase sirtuin-2, putative n=1 Tax=Entamoeba invadens IP1 TaxID=370355 RepID=A0A0A1U0N8_ENTIV|nr:NAD-dependent deacetylase sirtuin-2, putative [Entamoeba invadens IP1]ELP87437.1 NAD-dependent deacetylase sirtuin-2, putative [Entamoeba invadens IP1]|eukprot:XP_004254208.1 NAD-dependent deacetylase sirtuin-2, putative [Entamoeba invadens IP1]
MSEQSIARPPECLDLLSVKYTLKSLFAAIRKRKCHDCGGRDVWVCLTCLYVGCSTNESNHIENHYKQHDHPVCFNLRTMTFYCYECGDIVTSDILTKIRNYIIADYSVNYRFYRPYFNEYSPAGVAQYIVSHNVRNIIALVGAGMSTSAGIPDFRSPKTGLYFNLQKYNLPYPEAVFDMEYFPTNPAPFYEVMKDMYPGLGKYFPTKCHRFLKMLNDMGRLKMIFTQNIDGLEKEAGIPDEKVVYSHGTFRTARCLKCGMKFDNTNVFIENITKGEIIRCQCGGLIKPDIVFFNESLPNAFFENVETQFDDCDMLFVIGTAMVVYPFALLMEQVSVNCPRIVFNREEIGKSIDYSQQGRDAGLMGNCDDIAEEMCKAVGWKLD